MEIKIIYYQSIFNKLKMQVPIGLPSIVERLYQSLYSILAYVKPGLLKYENEYHGNKEEFIIREENLLYVIDDILCDHPRTMQYREAVHALIKNELHLSKNTKHSENRRELKLDICKYDHVKYMKIRENMLNLYSSGGKEISDELYEIGENPTNNLSNNYNTNKYYRSLLVNKLWRSKDDYDRNLSASNIKTKMIEDILIDARNAMKHNKYVFAAFWEYATKIS